MSIQARSAEFESRLKNATKDEANKVLAEMKEHLKKLEDARKNEDPRLSFVTPEFKESQRRFQHNYKQNFGRPVEWALVKEYPWSNPVLRKIEPKEATAAAAQ